MSAGAAAGLPPARIFFSYAHRDEVHRASLETHLKLLQRQGMVEGWHDRMIRAGEAWADEIDARLEEADVILLLVSADFLASDYCWDREMKRALERHDAGEARVIPVFVRTCEWRGAPFGRLQGLPRDARPVMQWDDPDEAWTNVAAGIRAAVESR